MLKLEKIQKEVEELKNKQSWIRESFKKIIEKVNEKVGDLGDINYYETYNERFGGADTPPPNPNNYLSNTNGKSTGWGIRHGKVKIIRTYYEGEPYGWVIVESENSRHFDKIEIENIKFMAEKLPEFLEKLYKHIENKNGKLENVKNELKDLLDKLNN